MKKPTPAQLAARARFAEMARSGAFKRKAKKNPAKRSGYRITLLDDNYEPIDSTFDTTEQGALLYAKDKVLQGMKGEITYKFPKGERLAFYFDATGIYKAGSTTPFYTPYPARAMNPAKRKKTVSQKISQLMHEGYPQKQAVAVALSEQRKGKVKRNPATGHKGSHTKLNPVKPTERTVYQVQHSKDGKTWDRWMTVMYLPMAKQIAQRLAAERPSEFVRVESFKMLM